MCSRILYFLLSIFNLVQGSYENFRFVVLPSNLQSIKSSKQTQKFVASLESNFASQAKYELSHEENFDIFLLMDGEEIVSFARLFELNVHSIEKRVSTTVFILYSFFVNSQYRGKSIAYSFLSDLVNWIKNNKKITSDTRLGLHLSINDKNMEKAARIYYKFGFCTGFPITMDPTELRFNYDKILNNSKDIKEVIRSKKEDKDSHFMFLSCKLADFRLDQQRILSFEDTALLRRFLETGSEKLDVL